MTDRSSDDDAEFGRRSSTDASVLPVSWSHSFTKHSTPSICQSTTTFTLTMLSPIARTNITSKLIIMVKYIDGEPLSGRRAQSGEVLCRPTPFVDGCQCIRKARPQSAHLAFQVPGFHCQPSRCCPGSCECSALPISPSIPPHQTEESDSPQRSSRAVPDVLREGRRLSE